MSRCVAILIHLLLVYSPLFPQEESVRIAQKRQENIESILRLQDLRTIHDGKLISFLSDPDTVVRERAVRAFGSIQDTTVLPLLVEALFDRNLGVQTAAAFGIGQTATFLSESGRRLLEYNLIWTRLDRTKAGDRLIEEIGKFGTEQALRDLVSRFGGNTSQQFAVPLMMSIARFAIRGITTNEAVLYLMRFIKPANRAPWQAVYALQRVGNHEQTRYEIEHVVQLYKHSDAVVRMHCATLLGKLKDERISLEPLMRLAEFDSDWRVRVNALRALGNFPLTGKMEVIRTFTRAFSDENQHVAVTALSVFGNTGVTEDSAGGTVETFRLLKRMAVNSNNHYPWQIQGEAAIALAKLSGSVAFPYIAPSAWPEPRLQALVLTALAYSGSYEAEPLILDAAKKSDPFVSRAVLEALQTLSRLRAGDSLLQKHAYDACLEGLLSGDVAVVSTAASVLGDSLFLRKTSVEPLLQTLTRLRIPDDIEAMQEIIATLGKVGDERAVRVLNQYLRKPDRSIALASASALKMITGKDYSAHLSRTVEPLFTDFDFTFLRSLRDTVRGRIETIRGEITFELYKNVAPFTVLNIVKLARRGFYRGLAFHRVVPNFVIQGGDPRGDGWGGPGYTIRSEFSEIPYGEGSVGIASAGKDTEGSQFFITHSPQPHLDGRYTLFGKVISGMNVVDRIQVGDRMFDVKIEE